jgi:hypothetical protein
MTAQDIRMIELCLNVIKERLDQQAQDDVDIAAAVAGVSEAIGQRFAEQDKEIDLLTERIAVLEGVLAAFIPQNEILF